MANDQHVAMLKEGVAAWNNWRAKNRNISPDLSEANLDGAILTRTIELISGTNRGRVIPLNLSEVNLSGAKLSVADISEANLGATALTWADLISPARTGPHRTEASR